MTTSLPAAKDALLTLLRASAGLSGVQVEWAHPGDAIARESVFFGNARLAQEYRSLGSGGDKSDAYTMELWVVVHNQGDDGKTTEDRVWALVGAVEDVLRSNKDLGLGPPTVLTLTAEFAGAELESFIELEGRTAQVRCDVSVTARI